MINLNRCVVDRTLPGAFFSSCAAQAEFSPERRKYEAAVQAYAEQTSPAALREYVAALRRHGIRVTQADAREAAMEALRETFLTLSYTETEVRWHAAQRGRRDRHLFATSMRSLESVTKPARVGGWRGPYDRRH